MPKVRIRPARVIIMLAMYVAVPAFFAGAVVGVMFSQAVDVPVRAVQTAREQVEREMSAACANWFTDKRTAALPEGRVVVCKAPKFLSNPAHQ